MVTRRRRLDGRQRSVTVQRRVNAVLCARPHTEPATCTDILGDRQANIQYTGRGRWVSAAAVTPSMQLISR